MINLVQDWQRRLANECPQNHFSREAIARWLIDDINIEIDPEELTQAQQLMEYRYQILRTRYLGVNPEQAYRHLICHLSHQVFLHQKIRADVSVSRDCQRIVIDVVQELVQDLIQRDRYIHTRMQRIAEHTSDLKLRNTLVLVTLEEYCLRRVGKQSFLLCSFYDHLQRVQSSALTYVP